MGRVEREGGEGEVASEVGCEEMGREEKGACDGEEEDKLADLKGHVDSISGMERVAGWLEGL